MITVQTRELLMIRLPLRWTRVEAVICPSNKQNWQLITVEQNRKSQIAQKRVKTTRTLITYSSVFSAAIQATTENLGHRTEWCASHRRLRQLMMISSQSVKSVPTSIGSHQTYMWEWRRRVFTTPSKPVLNIGRKLKIAVILKVGKSSAIKSTIWCHPLKWRKHFFTFFSKVDLLHTEAACIDCNTSSTTTKHLTSC